MSGHDVVMKQLHATFFEEARERVEALEAGLFELEARPADAELVNALFRAAHSIKGGAGMVGFPVLSDFTHAMETVLDAVRGQRLEVTKVLVGQLFEAVDHVGVLLGIELGRAALAGPVA